VKDCLVFGQQRFVDDLSLGLWRDDSGGTDGTYPIKSGMLRNVACLIHWATFHLSPSAGPLRPIRIFTTVLAVLRFNAETRKWWKFAGGGVLSIAYFALLVVFFKPH
jgi:hypothetical protein